MILAQGVDLQKAHKQIIAATVKIKNVDLKQEVLHFHCKNVQHAIARR
jgi:hypothetical protein